MRQLYEVMLGLTPLHSVRQGLELGAAGWIKWHRSHGLHWYLGHSKGVLVAYDSQRPVVKTDPSC